MILTREIEIKISQSNYQYFDDMGYTVSIGEKIKIPVELLSKGSHQKIKCECDGCGVEKDVIFKNYVKYDNIWGYYYCRKCSEYKRKSTLRENHGVEYPLQNKKIYDKMKKTIRKKRTTRNEEVNNK
jgi:hypothetical protein